MKGNFVRYTKKSIRETGMKIEREVKNSKGRTALLLGSESDIKVIMASDETNKRYYYIVGLYNEKDADEMIDKWSKL